MRCVIPLTCLNAACPKATDVKESADKEVQAQPDRGYEAQDVEQMLCELTEHVKWVVFSKAHEKHLRTGACIMIQESFVSHNAFPQINLEQGLIGKIETIDSDGDAQVTFPRLAAVGIGALVAAIS